jgi:hypothetical protein
MSRIKLTPVSGQVDTFDMTRAGDQPITIPTTPQRGRILGCTETVTLVHHIKDDDDTYTCHPAKNASWFSKVTISTSADGAKPVNTFEVRVFGEFPGTEPSLGDYVVKGIVEGIESPTDLKNMVYFRITAISDNRRGGLPHWRVSGQ